MCLAVYRVYTTLQTDLSVFTYFPSSSHQPLQVWSGQFDWRLWQFDHDWVCGKHSNRCIWRNSVLWQNVCDDWLELAGFGALPAKRGLCLLSPSSGGLLLGCVACEGPRPHCVWEQLSVRLWRQCPLWGRWIYNEDILWLGWRCPTCRLVLASCWTSQCVWNCTILHR